ncbi:MAG TPA: 5'/3'-nucleotidase SurE [Planctomycetaceae bacterium]|nr:5'/3'-nucleotidase SurE [Planctomycetaceae bacterium]
MQILLTNDDGIYAPGLAAMERALRHFGNVTVIAPETEQSGVGHSITFLRPLTTKRVYVNDEPWGWTLPGSPADCVKLGVSQICPERPGLIVSGINRGLNTGINIIYSGTVAAAVEGAFYGITSIAVSLEYAENEPFDRAALLAAGVIEKLLARKKPSRELFNLNIPIVALKQEQPEVRVVPMDVGQYWETFEKRTDPLGRDYFWLTGRPDPRQPKWPENDRLTDMKAIRAGYISLTPLDYDLTKTGMIEEMRTWSLHPDLTAISEHSEKKGPSIRTTR